MVSDLCNNSQKESDSSTTDPTSFCVAYDDDMDLNIDFRDTSPSFCEEIESGKAPRERETSSVAEECSPFSESVFYNTTNNIESQVSHDCVQITTKDMLLPSIIHNSQPRATNDIDSYNIVPMAEDKREPSRKRSITCDNRSDDKKYQEGVEIPPPKKRKRQRDPKIILEDQKKKQPVKPPWSSC
ncbi:hypothetical protein HHI36_009258 [Cryptolaemus montrouzieri]|uniref:Uncharacterized protein n=1 Tax=Cryptolaemus montrouzieri TaxID=559131 RepID=A0ABD2MVL9_9CUCU